MTKENIHTESMHEWPRVKLKDICDINPRRPVITRANDTLTTFVPMPAVAELGAGITRPELRPYSQVAKGYTYFGEGDVLFAKITPCMQNGKHAIARGLIDGIGFGSTEFHVLRPKPVALAEWIHSFLYQPSVLEEATAHFTGSIGQQRIPDSYLAELQIPLPSKDEQFRITTGLRCQLTEVEGGRLALAAQLEAAKALPGALLRAIFSSSTAQNWPQRKIGSIANVQSGYAFKSDWFSSDGVRLLRNVNVSPGVLRWDEIKRIPASRRPEFSAYELNEGDIVLSLDRPFVSDGLKLARVSKNDLPALLLQRVGRFILRGEVHADYLYAFLQTDSFIRAITTHDQSLGVPHVSPKQIEAIALPLPPMSVQKEVAVRLHTELQQAKSLREHVAQKLAAFEKMPATLLRAAFSNGI